MSVTQTVPNGSNVTQTVPTPPSGGGAGAADPTWVKTYQLDFTSAAFQSAWLGHSLRDDGDLTQGSVTYSGRNTGNSGLDDLVVTARGIEVQMTSDVGGGSVGIIFDLDSAVIGADTVTAKTRIAVQTYIDDPASLREQQQYIFSGPSGTEIYHGIAGNNYADHPVSAGMMGGASRVDSSDIPGVNYMCHVIHPYAEAVEWWYEVGATALAFPTPRTTGTMHDVRTASNRGAYTFADAPGQWTWRASLATLRGMIACANYWSTAEGGPGWYPAIQGVAVWRSDD